VGSYNLGMVLANSSATFNSKIKFDSGDPTMTHGRCGSKNHKGLHRLITPSFSITELRSDAIHEVYLTVTPFPEESPGNFATRVARLLRAYDLEPVHQFWFGSAKYYGEVLSILEKELGPGRILLTWCDGTNGTSKLYGAQVLAIRDVKPSPVWLRETLAGMTWQRGGLNYCFIGGLCPMCSNAPRVLQAETLFEELQVVLAQAGFTWKELIRTWFFLDDILSWYGEFNAVRNKVYGGVFTIANYLPASTGVGCKNPFSAAVSAAALALAGDKRIQIKDVPSPLQGPATAYGSAFSRAVEVVGPGWKRLLVSGTASIDRSGYTLHPNGIKKQVQATMRIVDALLHSRGMCAENIVRAIAYFPGEKYFHWFYEWAKRNWPSEVSVLLGCADICRRELLFEIELDAMVWTNEENE